MAEYQDNEPSDTSAPISQSSAELYRTIQLIIKGLLSLAFIWAIAWNIPQTEAQAQDGLIIGLILSVIILGIGVFNS